LQQIAKRLSYANVMSSIAVFLVLGGATAFAATDLGKNSVGSKQLRKNAVTSAKIKKNAVSAAKIKNGAVTGSKIKLSTLGTVPSAATAGHAGTADSATSAGHAATAERASTAGSVASVHVFKGGAVPAAADVASAPKVELGSVGPFNFYGKCFLESGDVHEVTYVELTSGTAILGSEGGANFYSNTTGYLTPSSPEADRAMKDQASAGADEFSAESYDEEFQASASDGTEITGEIGGTGAKQGNPPGGNGPFLAGDSCIVGAIAVFGS
jgi:hypothetical protein